MFHFDVAYRPTQGEAVEFVCQGPIDYTRVYLNVVIFYIFHLIVQLFGFNRL
jgi:hypothetical protein